MSQISTCTTFRTPIPVLSDLVKFGFNSEQQENNKGQPYAL